MDYLRAFIAGMILPSIFLPIFLVIVTVLRQSDALPLHFFYLLPIIWGVWNVLYFSYFRYNFPSNKTLRLLLTGAILGLLIAIYGVFWLDLPTLFHFPESLHCLPILIVPVVYALLWSLVVRPLNDIVGLKDE